MSKMTTETLDTFITILQKFLNAVQKVFPECTQTKKMVLKLELGLASVGPAKAAELKETIIRKWHEKLHPFYEQVKARDVTVVKTISEMETFQGMNLWGKWNDKTVRPGTHEVIWKYLDGLNKYSQMYAACNAIPSKVMTEIEGATVGIAEDLKAGRQPEANLLQIGKQVCDSMSPEELQEFAKSMMSNMGIFTSMLSSLTSESDGAPPEMSSLMSTLGQLAPKR